MNSRRMKPAADSPLPAMKKWWRLAVARRALVDFNRPPSLDRPNLHKLFGTPGRSRTHPLGFEDRAVPWNYERIEKVVERDGYAPSPPHCKCGVLLLSLRPQKESGHDGETCTRAPRLCRPVPWLLGHVVIVKK